MALSRQGLKLILGTAIATFATWGAALSQDGAMSRVPIHTEQLAPDFKLEQLSTNVYAFISNNTYHRLEDGNTTVILTDAGVVVVDASSGYLAKRHLSVIRRLTQKPVLYVINTHNHRDHVLGDYVYKNAFPNVQIIAQESSALIGDRRAPAVLESTFKGDAGKGLAKDLKDAATSGISGDGSKIEGYTLTWVRQAAAEYAAAYAANQDSYYVSPTLTYDNHMDLKLGSTEIMLINMPGHTRGDTVVYLPKEKILITGDLVVAPVPFGGGITDKWIESLNAMLDMPANVIVPGHGEVEFDKDAMRTERDLLQSLMDQAIAAVRKGESLDDFKKTVDVSEFKKKLAGNDPELDFGWDNYFLSTELDRAYAIAEGDY